MRAAAQAEKVAALKELVEIVEIIQDSNVEKRQLSSPYLVILSLALQSAYVYRIFLKNEDGVGVPNWFLHLKYTTSKKREGPGSNRERMRWLPAGRNYFLCLCQSSQNDTLFEFSETEERQII